MQCSRPRGAGDGNVLALGESFAFASWNSASLMTTRSRISEFSKQYERESRLALAEAYGSGTHRAVMPGESPPDCANARGSLARSAPEDTYAPPRIDAR